MESNSDLTEMGEGEDYVQKNEISSKIVVNYRWCPVIDFSNIDWQRSFHVQKSNFVFYL